MGNFAQSDAHCQEISNFRLLTDVNEWIYNECSECIVPHLNISNWFTFSHQSKGESHRSNCSKYCNCEQAYPVTIRKNAFEKMFVIYNIFQVKEANLDIIMDKMRQESSQEVGYV